MHSREGEKQAGWRWLRRAPGGLVLAHAAESQDGALGVLSGTFNPPTCAHFLLAAEAARQLALDEVLFILPETPPHKAKIEAPLEDRAEMLLRAIAGEPRFSAAICDRGLLTEIHQALAPHYAQSLRTVFLVGRDAAERILVRWPYPHPEQAMAEMFSRFEMGVADRSGRFALPGGLPAARYSGKIHALWLPPEAGTISSSRVRAEAGAGIPLEGLVAPEVAAYIKLKGLYKAGH
jgi:nicotinate (nicotinamide) nucleotide adenylyltransferase